MHLEIICLLKTSLKSVNEFIIWLCMKNLKLPRRGKCIKWSFIRLPDDPLPETLVETLDQTNAAFYPVRHFILTLFRRALMSAVSARWKEYRLHYVIRWQMSDFHPWRFYIYITLTKMLMITSLNLRIKRGGARTWFDGEMTVNRAFFISLCT